MTDDPAAAFKAVFADFRLVKTRNAAQLIFEVEIEAADAALAALGGLPKSHSGVWCAIALLDPKAAASAARKPPSAAAPPAPREPGKYASFPLAKQAAIRCATPEFWAFLEIEMPGGNVGSAEEAATRVRCFCRVESRKDILTGTEEGEWWMELDQRFLDWKHAVPLAEPTR